MFDLIVHGATVIDGTGQEPRTADVGVVGDRITEVGTIPADAPAARRIDATGRVVAPGFVDIHTHSDLHLVADGRGESKLRQGVTTEVPGNCGFSPFPIAPERLDQHADHLLRATATIRPWWTDVRGYADALTDQGLSLNVAPLAGHGAVRIAALGNEQRPATPDELATMQRLLDESLEQGAWGMSTGLTHVPSAYGDHAEVMALCETLAARDALYATHSRSSSEPVPQGHEEAILLGRGSGVRVQFSHLAINNPDRWGTGDRLLAKFDEARADGVDIAFDVYPYVASSSSLSQHLPPWVQSGGDAAMRARLTPGTTERDRARRDLERGWMGGIPFLWDRFVIADAPGGYGVGSSIAELAGDGDPYDTMLDLLAEFGGLIRIVLFYRVEEDVSAFLAHPLASVGSDGNAIPLAQDGRALHPRSFGTFPRVLGRYVRELGVLDLADAVHKMSGAPARRLGLVDRGEIRVGAHADLVVFDPVTVADAAEFGKPPSAPIGIDTVVVNGSVALHAGVITDARPGRVLLRA